MLRQTRVCWGAVLVSVVLLSACRPAAPTATPVPIYRPAPTLAPTEVAVSPSAEPTDAEPTAYKLDPRVSASSNAFGIELLALLSDAPAPQNMMISPLSLLMALGMTANGAIGQTQADMLSALRLEDLTMEEANLGLAALQQALNAPDLPVTLAIANALWLKQGTPFSEAYLQSTARYYGAQVEALAMDDAAAERINAWVRENTLGEIDQIVTPPINRATVMFLTNAIYFRGLWRAPFDPDKTQQQPFYALNGAERQVPMMRQTGRFALWHDQGYRVLALPYGDQGELQMWVALPDARDGLPALLEGLSADDLTRWAEGLAPAEVQLALPRFESDYEVSLNDALAALGMGIAFGAEADFGGMSPEGQAFMISEVKHKSVVKVDEEGTVAAAVTSVEVSKSAAVQREVFVADHPFLYGIWDGTTGTLLFVGVLAQP